MEDADVFELINEYADKHRAKVLLSCDNGWIVTLKGDTTETGKGASPKDAYTDLCQKLRLVAT